ncbi:sulfatase-like hydrolase/transferase [Rubrivirga marina]|uniref:Sulfatase N-terminal domain-containing protein n=1 Tax=Rubrivirga marina TaxID=1196024 RepID=A0A271IYV3_9BACT|nr:sulfatase-like hydrolase/transferase [Rubrivirga marina]PAP76310.1 hypothetical protein BSZ37_07555 [Rubrivirga marina]
MSTVRTVLLCLVAAVAARAQPLSGVLPDVVIIVADDVGFGDVGYNGSDIRTPNWDRLAAEGVVLDRFYAASQCSPSRAALLTGRYGLRMGINDPVSPADTIGIPLSEVTLAEALGAAGYETAAVGKWHLGDECHQHPTRHGFDSYVGVLGSGAHYFDRSTYWGTDWWRNHEVEQVEGYTTDLLAVEAVEVLSRPRDGPVFLYLPFTASHGPFEARPEDLADYAHLGEPRRTFAAMTARLDWAIGEVMDAIRRTGRPTLVWVLSDNGGHDRQGASNGPLRGRKGLTLEGGIRVPSVVWYAPLGAGRVEHPVWIADVLPTLLSLVEVERPAGPPLDGADQSAQLAGAPPTDALLDRVLFSYRRVDADTLYWLSAQTARWKFVREPSRRAPREALYRIDLDPFEAADSLDVYPERAAWLRDQALAFRDQTWPGASHDLSLTDLAVPDLSACPQALPSTPRPTDFDVWVGPNPFASQTTVRLRMPASAAVRVDVLDALGRRVRTLFEGAVTDPEVAVPFRAGGLPSGVYLVRVSRGGPAVSVPVVLTR